MLTTIGATKLDVSLIICTKNGGARLLECLNHIERLNIGEDLQLVLVDNGSTDHVSFDYLKSFKEMTRFNCEVSQTFIPGNAAGRNLARHLATGELLIFVDDDCYAHPNLISDWIDIFTNKNIGFGSGRILKFHPNQSCIGCVENGKTNIIPAGCYIWRGLIQGSNMAFRRECLDAVNWFDIRFGAGTPFAGEEWDAAVRSSFAGWSGGYFPAPTVRHDHGRSEDAARERILYYDYGAGAVFAKNLRGKALNFRCRKIMARKLAGELFAVRCELPRLASVLSGFIGFLFQ